MGPKSLPLSTRSPHVSLTPTCPPAPAPSPPHPLQATSNTMDLRFVPEGTAFPNAPRDAAEAVPDDYAPPRFYTAALQSSHVELTCEC
jgi:hypothetical protein